MNKKSILFAFFTIVFLHISLFSNSNEDEFELVAISDLTDTQQVKLFSQKTEGKGDLRGQMEEYAQIEVGACGSDFLRDVLAGKADKLSQYPKISFNEITGIAGWSALHLAVINNDFEVAQALVKSTKSLGINLHWEDRAGRTPLELAEYLGFVGLACCLRVSKKR